MADTKITGLTALGAVPDKADVVAIVDDPSGTPETKKVTVAELISPPIVILSKSSTDSQNVGGANGTEVWWTWDGQTLIDSEYTHSTSTNPSRVTVGSAGWYHIIFTGSAQQTGGGRTTLLGIYRINGGTTKRHGTMRNYSRGSGYGNLTAGLNTIIQLSASDYIEVGTRVDDSDGTYTITAPDGTEVTDEECQLTIIRVR